jgi:hypothetical protein
MAVQVNDQNWIVLTLYIIGISYTLNQMVESIDEIAKLDFQKDLVDQQLTEQNLQDKIAVTFKTGTYSIDKLSDDLKEVSMSIENKSDNLVVYIDWDNSSWVDSKQSFRVIRKSPDLTRDLAVPQVATIIAPKKTTSENITSENVFQLDKESGTYQPKFPLVNIAGLKESNKKLYKQFMLGQAELEFSLQLVLRVSELRVGITPGMNIPPISIINCSFKLKKLPWTYALPWNKKKK